MCVYADTAAKVAANAVVVGNCAVISEGVSFKIIDFRVSNH